MSGRLRGAALFIVGCAVTFWTARQVLPDLRPSSPGWLLTDLQRNIENGREAVEALPQFRAQVRELEDRSATPESTSWVGEDQAIDRLRALCESTGVAFEHWSSAARSKVSAPSVELTISGPAQELNSLLDSMSTAGSPWLVEELRLEPSRDDSERLRLQLAIDVTTDRFELGSTEGLPEPSKEPNRRPDIVFVDVPGGTFLMRPYWRPHQVTLSAFRIGKYEVTNEQFGVEGIRPGSAEAKLPVTEVSWFRASDFCRRYEFRLPTEAEWEYAARSGSVTEWSFGNDVRLLGGFAWFWANSETRAHQVGTKNPNSWGIHDMHGNVREWVADWHGPYPQEARIDPRGPSHGIRRVQRGGSFHGQPLDKLSASHRFAFPPEASSWNVGFRCAHSVPAREVDDFEP